MHNRANSAARHTYEDLPMSGVQFGVKDFGVDWPETAWYDENHVLNWASEEARQAFFDSIREGEPDEAAYWADDDLAQGQQEDTSDNSNSSNNSSASTATATPNTGTVTTATSLDE